MTTTDYQDLYRRVYALFDGVTPLRADCGAVCGKACCRGDQNTGMRLFPHEETPLRVTENEGRRFAVCDGVCDRKTRPLACRIFPFFPVPDGDGRIRAVPDPRAKAVCPLARQAENVAFRRTFLRRVEKAGRLLAKDGACRAFLEEISAEIREVAALTALLDDGND